MSRVIRRTRQLRDDIIRIYASIHANSPQGADKVFDAIQRSIIGLADAPGVGRYWNSPNPRLEGMKVTTARPYRNYLIFFRAQPRAIEVFRVIHGARELKGLIDAIDLDFPEE